MKLHYKLWLAGLFLLIAFIIWWLEDSRRYDDDLERDFIMETGKTWEDIE